MLVDRREWEHQLDWVNTPYQFIVMLKVKHPYNSVIMKTPATVIYGKCTSAVEVLRERLLLQRKRREMWERIYQYWKPIAWSLGAGQVTGDCIVYTALLSEACCSPFLSLSEYLCHHLWSWGWGPCRPGAILGYIVSPRSLKYRVRPCLKHNKIKQKQTVNSQENQLLMEHASLWWTFHLISYLARSVLKNTSSLMLPKPIAFPV